MRTPLALIVLVLAACAFPCAADEQPLEPQDPMLVHLDTPVVLEQGRIAARADLRAFGGDEDVFYATIGLHYGMGGGLEAILRGTFGDRRNFDLPGGSYIRHGGGDVEAAAKYLLGGGANPTAALLGIGWASTPAQDEAVVTLGLASSSNLGSGVTGYLCPRAVLIDGNTILGIGMGVRARVSDTLAVVADYTPIVSGDNTRSTTTGEMKRRDVWGLAIRYTPLDANWSLDIGYATGTGTTTGFGLTPGLGGSGAFYAAFSFRH